MTYFFEVTWNQLAKPRRKLGIGSRALEDVERDDVDALEDLARRVGIDDPVDAAHGLVDRGALVGRVGVATLVRRLGDSARLRGGRIGVRRGGGEHERGGEQRPRARAEGLSRATHVPPDGQNASFGG